MALFESSRGNFIPFFIEEFNTNNATISFILSLNTVGCVIGSFTGGHMCEKFGHKLVFITGSIISTLAIFMSPFISNIYFLGLFYFIFGIGRSALSVSVDSLVPALSIGFEVILMNITHFMYGLGSFAGQSIYGKLLFNGISWRNIYLYLGIFFVISIIFTLFMKIPTMRIVQDHQSIEGKELYKNPIIFLFVLAITFQIVSESIVNTWFINYIRSSYAFNPADAATYASIFFMLFATGRLAGGFIVNKLGDARGLKIFLLSAASFIFLGLILKRSGLIFISISGFFISIGFPTLMVLINKTFKQNASFAIGLTTTLGNVFFVLLFNLSGILNDLIGTYLTFFMAPASLIGSFIVITIIAKKENLS
jgi:fucose permease